MPNGKPGDHPLTDILVHNVEAFSPEVDALIKEIVSLDGQDDLERQFNLFWPPPLEEFESELRVLLDRLHEEQQD